MKIVPIITEKSIFDAKNGVFTFKMDVGLTKHQIKKLISDMFKVTVTKVSTINIKPRTKKRMSGKKYVKKGYKKAYVLLKDKEKIDLYEA